MIKIRIFIIKEMICDMCDFRVRNKERMEKHVLRHNDMNKEFVRTLDLSKISYIYVHIPKNVGTYIRYKLKKIKDCVIINHTDDLVDDRRRFVNINHLRFCGVKNGALSITSNAPLCSFRGGPVMSYDFFVRFFDIHRNIDVKKDPEKRVRNYIHYGNVHKGDICIFVVYLLEYMGETLEFLEENSWFYRSRYNALRFDGGRLRYFMVMMEKVEDDDMYIYEYKSNNLGENRVKELKKIFRKIGMEELWGDMGGNSISFFNFVPYMMEDIGRKFNRDNGLKKINNSYG